MTATDLERFARRLVASLAGLGPDGARRAITVGEISRSLLPYRVARRELGVDSAEDYDMLLLRLASGEGGFARLESSELAAAAEAEARSPNPDLHFVRALGDAMLRLAPERIGAITEPAVDRREEPARSEPVLGEQAPPPPALDTEVITAEPVSRGPTDTSPTHAGLTYAGPAPADATTDPRCPFCGAALPPGRPARFCPSCGARQPARCPGCGGRVEEGWRYCVECGERLDAGRP
ncbi:MAG TPA: zinc ribbon domain-containing protein [Gemmatimonadales bacterium]|nr:zinc ribbon domain-containing protein [Gemmatimonadales bacterium]